MSNQCSKLETFPKRVGECWRNSSLRGLTTDHKPDHPTEKALSVGLVCFPTENLKANLSQTSRLDERERAFVAVVVQSVRHGSNAAVARSAFCKIRCGPCVVSSVASTQVEMADGGVARVSCQKKYGRGLARVTKLQKQ